jgi:hypothetical protein
MHAHCLSHNQQELRDDEAVAAAGCASLPVVLDVVVEVPGDEAEHEDM